METLTKYNKSNNYSNWNIPEHPIQDPAVFVRWTKYIPVFHKYAGEVCFGFQLHPIPGVQYHALAHNLRIINFVRENCPGFSFREGKYEAGNDRTAIELLLGDQVLLDYVNGKNSWEDAREHMKIEEQKWIRKAKKFMLYEEQLFRSK